MNTKLGLIEALKIVYDLAIQNSIDLDDPDIQRDNALRAEGERQLDALKQVQAFIIAVKA